MNDIDIIGQKRKDDLEKYVRGGELTEDAKAMVRDLLERLNIGLGLSVVEQLSRRKTLENFVKEAETYLFDPARIPNMDYEEVSKLLAQANKNLFEINEFSRKFIVHNKELLYQDVEPEEKNTISDLTRLLSNMPQDKLERVAKAIESIASENNFGNLEDIEEI
nr:MAG TPA: hypothetical protein [Caudoviricetes sp.]